MAELVGVTILCADELWNGPCISLNNSISSDVFHLIKRESMFILLSFASCSSKEKLLGHKVAAC